MGRKLYNDSLGVDRIDFDNIISMENFLNTQDINGIIRNIGNLWLGIINFLEALRKYDLEEELILNLLQEEIKQAELKIPKEEIKEQKINIEKNYKYDLINAYDTKANREIIYDYLIKEFNNRPKDSKIDIPEGMVKDTFEEFTSQEIFRLVQNELQKILSTILKRKVFERNLIDTQKLQISFFVSQTNKQRLMEIYKDLMREKLKLSALEMTLVDVPSFFLTGGLLELTRIKSLEKFAKILTYVFEEGKTTYKIFDATGKISSRILWGYSVQTVYSLLDSLLIGSSAWEDFHKKALFLSLMPSTISAGKKITNFFTTNFLAELFVETSLFTGIGWLEQEITDNNSLHFDPYNQFLWNLLVIVENRLAGYSIKKYSEFENWRNYYNNSLVLREYLDEIIKDPSLKSKEMSWGILGNIKDLIENEKLTQDERKALARKIKQDTIDLETTSTEDALTGLNNLRFYISILPKKIDRSLKIGKGNVTMLMLDINDFKQVNDTFGHDTGNKILYLVTKIMKENIRAKDDFAIRYGGEEFMIIYTGNESFKIGQKKAIEIFDLIYNDPEIMRLIGMKNHGLSIGIATNKIGDTLDQLHDRADKLLYEAKKLKPPKDDDFRKNLGQQKTIVIEK
jgi:diguanylate cyclase (GGDEF)-like protein